MGNAASDEVILGRPADWSDPRDPGGNYQQDYVAAEGYHHPRRSPRMLLHHPSDDSYDEEEEFHDAEIMYRQQQQRMLSMSPREKISLMPLADDASTTSTSKSSADERRHHHHHHHDRMFGDDYTSDDEGEEEGEEEDSSSFQFPRHADSLTDRDDVTAMTDMAHDGDDEATVQRRRGRLHRGPVEILDADEEFSRMSDLPQEAAAAKLEEQQKKARGGGKMNHPGQVLAIRPKPKQHAARVAPVPLGLTTTPEVSLVKPNPAKKQKTKKKKHFLTVEGTFGEYVEVNAAHQEPREMTGREPSPRKSAGGPPSVSTSKKSQVVVKGVDLSKFAEQTTDKDLEATSRETHPAQQTATRIMGSGRSAKSLPLQSIGDLEINSARQSLPATKNDPPVVAPCASISTRQRIEYALLAAMPGSKSIESKPEMELKPKKQDVAPTEELVADASVELNSKKMAADVTVELNPKREEKGGLLEVLKLFGVASDDKTEAKSENVTLPTRTSETVETTTEEPHSESKAEEAKETIPTDTDSDASKEQAREQEPEEDTESSKENSEETPNAIDTPKEQAKEEEEESEEEAESTTKQNSDDPQAIERMTSADFEGIDLQLVEEYEDTFEAFLKKHPEFKRQNPEMVEVLHVAKLQKLLSLTSELEADLTEYIQSLKKQKKEIAAYYQGKLLEAAKKKASREIHLQQELTTVQHATRVMQGKLTWQMVSLCEARAKKQSQLLAQLSERRADPANPLAILGDQEDMHAIRDAVQAPAGADLTEKQFHDLQQFQVDNEFLNKEASVLEKKLAYLQITAKKHSWVDSVFRRMDAKQHQRLKHRYQKKLGVTF
jgi:hypothetical protein